MFSCITWFIYIPSSSLEEIWVTALNITGPLSSWSFADNVLPGTKVVSSTWFFFWIDIIFSLHDVVYLSTGTETYDGGPQSYILRLSGPSEGNWSFWLEVKFQAALNFFSFTIKAEFLFCLITSVRLVTSMRKFLPEKNTFYVINYIINIVLTNIQISG